MLKRSVVLLILYFMCVLVVLSVTLENTNAIRHIGSSEATRESFLNDTALKTYFPTNYTRTNKRRLTKFTKFENPTKFDARNIEARTSVKSASISKKKELLKEKIRQMMPRGSSKIRNKPTRTEISKTRRKSINAAKEQRDKIKRERKLRILQNLRGETKTAVMKGHQAENLDGEVTCTNSSLTSLSLRNLFRVPKKMQRSTDCSNRQGSSSGMQRNTSSGQSSGRVSFSTPLRFSDKGHTELINQFEKEQSLDELAGEYVHPEGHISPRTANYRKSDVMNSVFGLFKPKLQSESSVMEVGDNLGTIIDNDANMEMHYNDDGAKVDYYLSLKQKRDVEMIIDEQEKFRAKRIDNITGQHGATEKNLYFKEPDEEQTQNSTSQNFLRDFNNIRATDTPWPLIPGPISCDLDIQLQPSFVAKLGEFDYVVSVQLQRNPDEPADHACTGVIYNPRFIIIAPHCLHDNYGLTVTSTDDLCTIDEMIEVDYIIEHESYDAETRKNDIALIKLKSEIHKRAAKFPKDDGSVGKNFYAVGFGELMWRSFPDKISKLLQKVPVRRYSRLIKEAPGTLHITTSHMDLTGSFRGDFGGALINPRGEFVGLKSRLVKKSTEYEVYTKVRTYLPWIQSMVALHGSW